MENLTFDLNGIFNLIITRLEEQGSFDQEAYFDMVEEVLEEKREVGEMDGEFDVKDKNVLLLDDMISTGGTMLKALEKLQAAGAKKICCAATHGLFLYNCIDKIRKFTDCVYSTDTIVNPHATVSIKDKLAKL